MIFPPSSAKTSAIHNSYLKPLANYTCRQNGNFRDLDMGQRLTLPDRLGDTYSTRCLSTLSGRPIQDMSAIEVKRIIDNTLAIVNDVEAELYQNARHSSKLSEIADFKQWLKFGHKQGAFCYACTIDGDYNARQLCFEVFDHIGFSPETIAEYCLEMISMVGNDDYFAIRFNPDDATEYGPDDYFEDQDGFVDCNKDKDGELIVPYRKVLLTVWREYPAHVRVEYHVFFHALRQYLQAQSCDGSVRAIAQKFGLTDESDAYCDRLAIIPSFLNELTTELLWARLDSWHTISTRAAALSESINGRFY
ncbi:hypothetical protein H744_1c0049 [Photobacterium gaetbulicola Gung47]|uniref:Uncharacterized protein n=2 Tax=Photobacterium gaetbulicola TaxID=1295392 RepID=A0A0C5WFW6_9GAMM|nr:hypothetical protein H744_1c0049 [Photobacterium gaetbulicola Gung47]